MEAQEFTGAELAARRNAAGLTQDDLAKLLGVSRRTVVSWEADHGTLSPMIDLALTTIEARVAGAKALTVKIPVYKHYERLYSFRERPLRDVVIYTVSGPFRTPDTLLQSELAGVILAPERSATRTTEVEGEDFLIIPGIIEHIPIARAVMQAKSGYDDLSWLSDQEHYDAEFGTLPIAHET